MQLHYATIADLNHVPRNSFDQIHVVLTVPPMQRLKPLLKCIARRQQYVSGGCHQHIWICTAGHGDPCNAQGNQACVSATGGSQSSTVRTGTADAGAAQEHGRPAALGDSAAVSQSAPHIAAATPNKVSAAFPHDTAHAHSYADSWRPHLTWYANAMAAHLLNFARCSHSAP